MLRTPAPMLRAFENRLFDQMRGMVRYVSPVAPSRAEGLVGQTYRQMRAEFQLAPPLTLHSPRPEILAGAWCAMRETEIVPGHLSRAEKEAIAGAVSQSNACPYCVDAHTGMLESEAPGVGKAIRGDAPENIQNARLRALVQWASSNRIPAAAVVKSPPWSSSEAPEAIGVAVLYHYVNRMVHVFLGDGLLPFPSRMRHATRHVFAATFGRRMVQRTGEPGASLSLLPETELPPDMGWAAATPHIGAAWARFASAVETAGRRSVPDEVRALVEQRLQRWAGEEAPLSSAWVDQEVGTLHPSHQPAARFALLVALASYRVDDRTVASLHTGDTSDGELVDAASWAAFQAARRIGSWLSTNHDRR